MSPTSFDLSFEPRDHYLYARVEGPEDTFDVSVAYWSQIAAECAARGTRRLLVDEALAGDAVPAEMEQVVEALIQMGFRDVRIAFVDATESAALLVNAEIRVAQGGLVGRAFRRVDEAERWLLADRDAPPVAS